MVIADEKGNELLELIFLEESQADEKYHPITHALGVVRLGDDYLMGWNRYRKDWEIFGGCREEGETLRACMERECREELGLSGLSWTFLGLMRLRLAPGYFNPEWHEEYGGLFGVSLPPETLEVIEKYRADREEIERLALYQDIKEGIAPIDGKLLTYWN